MCETAVQRLQEVELTFPFVFACRSRRSSTSTLTALTTATCVRSTPKIFSTTLKRERCAKLNKQMPVPGFKTYIHFCLSLLGVQEKFVLSNYMLTHTSLNPEMRAILVDWLVEVQVRFLLLGCHGWFF